MRLEGLTQGEGTGQVLISEFDVKLKLWVPPKGVILK